MRNGQIMEEAVRWRGREVGYRRGSWGAIVNTLPTFKLGEFRACEDGPANPHLKSVIRLPDTLFEKAVPVGVVSRSYSLAQHKDVAARCLEGLALAGVAREEVECEVGLTELGEWMNLRFYFPERYTYWPADGYPIRLRLECTNSVDRSSRLTVLLSWLRVICTNGWVLRGTRFEIRDVHNEYLKLDRIPEKIADEMGRVQHDLRRLRGWEETLVDLDGLEVWVNDAVARRWGKKAACRVWHICVSGYDVEYRRPFAKGGPTEKPVRRLFRVPGSKERAETVFDVSQALSWVASRRRNPEERLEWQSGIDGLIRLLKAG